MTSKFNKLVVSHVKKIIYPNCVDCKHFIKAHSFLPRKTDTSFSRCSMFGTKDVVSGKIMNDYTDWSRQDNNRCGVEGKYFTPYK